MRATGALAILLYCLVDLPLAHGKDGGGKGEGGFAPGAKCSNPRSELENFRKCVSNAEGVRKDVQQCVTKVAECVEPRTRERELQPAGEKAFAECKAMRRPECDELYTDITGKTLSKPSDPREAKNAEKFLTLKGLPDAIGNRVENCIENATSREEERLCQGKAREYYKEVAAGGGNLDEIGEAMLDRTLDEAGRSKAGQFIETCIALASTPADKQACLRSEEAKKQFALASGKDRDDIDASYLRKAAETRAKDSIGQAVKICVEAASTAEEKKACRKQDDLKDLIAGSTAKDKADIKDSEVRQYLDKGAEDDLLTAMKACTKGSDAATLAACKNEAKRVTAAALGKAESDITDFILQKSNHRALGRDIQGLMEVCMDNATSREEFAKCRRVAKATLKDADMKGEEPSGGKVERMLDEAAINAVKGVRQDCSGEADCVDKVKDRVAKAMGKHKSEVDTFEAREFMERSAEDSAARSAKACVEAKQDDSSATCDDVYTTYLNELGKGKPGDETAAKTQEKRVKGKAAKDVAKEAREVCYELATKSEVETCLQDSVTVTDGALELLAKDQDMSNDKWAKKKQHLEREADVEVLGDRYVACRRAAENATDAEACLDDLKRKKSFTSASEDADATLKKFFAKVLLKPSQSCTTADVKECRKQAKVQVLSSGLEREAFAAVKKLGEIRSAAEEMAACMDAGGADAVCDTQAMEAFLGASGADRAAYGYVKQRIVSLAAKIRSFEQLILRRLKRLAVTVGTDATACVEALENKMMEKVRQAALNASRSGNVTKKPCRLVEALAEYSADFGMDIPDAEFSSVGSAVAGDLSGLELSARRLSQERRLATVGEVYATQDISECAENDVACANGEVSSLDTSSTTTTPSNASQPSSTIGSNVTSNAAPAAANAAVTFGKNPLSVFVAAVVAIGLFAAHKL